MAPVIKRSRSRSRSRSVSGSRSATDSDADGEYRGIDPALVGMDGLHQDQRPTASRLKNPGKYTDKSLRQAHSRRSNKRERSSSLPAVTGGDERVTGTCVNSQGAIKRCRDLVTRWNFRSTYVNGNRLPLQTMYAMLLDEQPEVLHTYDRARVLSYLAGVIARALSGKDDEEPSGWANLMRFANHTVNLLSQEHAMSGSVDPVEVLAERYLTPIFEQDVAYGLIHDSIRLVRDTSVINILKNLATLVEETNPEVRLWAYDVSSPRPHDTVMLRRGQVRQHPWERLKDTLETSIRSFGGARGTSRDKGGGGGGDEKLLSGVGGVRVASRKREETRRKREDGKSSAVGGVEGSQAGGSRSSKHKSQRSGMSPPRTPGYDLERRTSQRRKRPRHRSRSRSDSGDEGHVWVGGPPPTPGRDITPSWLKLADNFGTSDSPVS